MAAVAACDADACTVAELCVQEQMNRTREASHQCVLLLMVMEAALLQTGACSTSKGQARTTCIIYIDIDVLRQLLSSDRSISSSAVSNASTVPGQLAPGPVLAWSIYTVEF